MNPQGSQEGKLHNSVNFERPRINVSHSQKFSELPVDKRAEALREWLANGWILELARSPQPGVRLSGRVSDFVGDQGFSSEAEFLIGGGAVTPLSFEALETAESAVWTPDFFPQATQPGEPGGEHRSPFTSQWSFRATRDELLAWLGGIGHVGGIGHQNAFLKSITLADVASSKISWASPRKEGFQKGFERIRTAFQSEGVKKAVPVVFATGVTATADRLEWLANRICAGLLGTAANDLRLYGSWSEDRGVLGATPEALFTRIGTIVSSMAVAGTRALSTLGASAQDPTVFAGFAREFLEDAKERNEHELVVADIESVLSQADAEIEKSVTGVERFGALLHLVTHLTSRSKSVPGVQELVERLHPTPALGVSPRDSSLKLLREVHEFCGGGVSREGFGAPFVVKHGGRVDAIVAIRQLRWNFDDTDRIHVTVGSGCGVVVESDCDREWAELEAKRRAVMKLFRVSTEKSEPVFWSLEIIEKLLSAGVRRFIVCAGARNAPLVVAAEALRKAAGNAISVESFFEERVAAFYALGLSRATKTPVAILTTSGTAVAELLPAIVEADFSGVPLIAVTADRPRRLRLSGAPQSIPQNGLFGEFVERAWDLEEGDEFSGLEAVSGLRPLHVNVCLEEPLLADAERAPDRLAERARTIVTSLSVKAGSASAKFGSSIATADHSMAYAALATLFAKRKLGRGLVAVVGGLEAGDREAVADFLKAHAIPCLLEGPSGLRGDKRLQDLELIGGDRDLQRWCLSGELAMVLRLGGVPTARVWRDLDDAKVTTQTLSISRLRFSGLGRGQFIHLPAPGEFANFLRRSTPLGVSVTADRVDTPLSIESAWLAQDRLSASRLETVLSKYSRSEPTFVRTLSEIIPADAMIYVGNSLPIRWWDMVATRASTTSVEANRGVNGIDGQLSTAFGLASGSGVSVTGLNETWILVGDLTALYDLAAPWALGALKLQNPSAKVRIVVLNNGGGRIFKRVLAKAPGGAAPFENEHNIEFKKWAEMWNLGYARVMSQHELRALSGRLDQSHTVIELIPSSDETASFWTEL